MNLQSWWFKVSSSTEHFWRQRRTFSSRCDKLNTHDVPTSLHKPPSLNTFISKYLSVCFSLVVVSDEDAAVGTNIRPLKTSVASRPVSAGSSTLLPAAAELSAFTLDSALRKPGGTIRKGLFHGDPSFKSDLSYSRSRVPPFYVFHLWKHTKRK